MKLSHTDRVKHREAIVALVTVDSAVEETHGFLGTRRGPLLFPTLDNLWPLELLPQPPLSAPSREMDSRCCCVMFYKLVTIIAVDGLKATLSSSALQILLSE